MVESPSLRQFSAEFEVEVSATLLAAVYFAVSGIPVAVLVAEDFAKECSYILVAFAVE